MIPQNSQKVVDSETENTAFNKEIPKAKYISPEKQHYLYAEVNIIIITY